MTENQKPGKNEEQSTGETRQPYKKPSFRFEQVFETNALSCGKVSPTQGICGQNRKSS